MKKLALFIAVIMFALSIVSCQGEPGATDTDDNNRPAPETQENPEQIENQEEEEKSKYDVADDLGEHNLNGYVFRGVARENNGMDVEAEIGEVLNDAIYYRNRSVEERFNFKFEEKITPTGEYANPMKNSLLAGDKAYDIMIIRGPDAFSFAAEGLLRPMTDLPHVDFEKPYWDEWLTSQFSIANKSFFAAGAYDLTIYAAAALLFNKPLAQDLGLENLYALVREGKWTFDKFEEVGRMAIRDLNGDGSITVEDQHGLLGITRNIQPSFWIAGGAKTIEKDENDIPYLNALDSRFIDVWFKMVDMLVTNEVWFHNVSDPNLHPNPLWETVFKDGRALFLRGTLTTARDLRDMDIDFGILPHPKFNEQQDKYYSQLPWIEILSLPIYADESDMERTSIILEAIASESYRTVTPIYVDLILRSKFTRDDESEEMINIIFENRIFDWGDTIWTSLLRDGIFPGIFIKNSDTVVSRLERAEPNIQKEINRMVEAFLALD